MENTLVTIKYKTVGGITIDIYVSPEIAEVIEETDRKDRSQKRQDRRHSSQEYIDGFTDSLAFNPLEDLLNQIIRKYDIETLYAAIETLSNVQKSPVLRLTPQILLAQQYHLSLWRSEQPI